MLSEHIFYLVDIYFLSLLYLLHIFKMFLLNDIDDQLAYRRYHMTCKNYFYFIFFYYSLSTSH